MPNFQELFLYELEQIEGFSNLHESTFKGLSSINPEAF